MNSGLQGRVGATYSKIRYGDTNDKIMAARWYEVKGQGLTGGALFVSAAEIGVDDPEDEITIEDYFHDVPVSEILRVDDVLKRYTPEDGYYHA